MTKNAYVRAGVDVEAGYEVVARIKKHVDRTRNLGVMGAIGGFGGCFDLSAYQVENPVLVSGTDGVGTKVLLAIQANKHDTIGIDCVAMCVNDIVVQGARPLFFLDYLATGKNVPEKIEQVVSGVAEGCVQAGAALIGGETAEMPGMYADTDYDLAGFTVGIVDKEKLIDGSKITAGDVLIGIPASGLHSNGFSLVRKVFFEQNDFTGDSRLPELAGKPLMEELLTPTKIYVNALLPLLEKKLLHGAAHITGGGFVENIPRMLPADCACEIQLGSWPVLPVFDALSTYGQIPEREMYEIFNMGIGMVLAVSETDARGVIAELNATGEEGFVIGRVTEKDTEPIIFKGVEK